MENSKEQFFTVSSSINILEPVKGDVPIGFRECCYKVTAKIKTPLDYQNQKDKRRTYLQDQAFCERALADVCYHYNNKILIGEDATLIKFFQDQIIVDGGDNKLLDGLAKSLYMVNRAITHRRQMVLDNELLTLDQITISSKPACTDAECSEVVEDNYIWSEFENSIIRPNDTDFLPSPNESFAGNPIPKMEICLT